jgi:flavin reductase (DIM6/NTAB) family NADH-FMN oxidoreductase RutF
MAISEETKRTLGKPIGRIPSGVYILTAEHAGVATAMLASWVQQASFDPPAISIALAKERPIARLIRQSGKLALSVLAHGEHGLMKRYGRAVPEGVDPFEGVPTRQTPAGLAVMAESLAWLEARVVQWYDFGADHDLLIAEVTAGEILREGQPFMHVRGNGFHY